MRTIPRRFGLSLGAYLAFALTPAAVLVLRPSLTLVSYLPVLVFGGVLLAVGVRGAEAVPEQVRYRCWSTRGTLLLLLVPAAYFVAFADGVATDVSVSTTGPLLVGVVCGVVAAVSLVTAARVTTVPSDPDEAVYRWESRPVTATRRRWQVAALLVMVGGWVLGYWQYANGNELLVAGLVAAAPTVAVLPTLLGSGRREWAVTETGLTVGSDHRPWRTFSAYERTNDVLVLRGADWHGPLRIACESVPDEAELVATLDRFLPSADG